MSRPLLWILTAWMVGVLVSVIPNSNLLVVAFASSVIVVSILLYSHIKKQTQLFSVVLLFFVFIVGMVYGYSFVEKETQLPYIERESIEISGVVSKLWDTPYNRMVIVKTDDDHDIQVRVALVELTEELPEHIITRAPLPELKPGDQITVIGEYRVPNPKWNPGGFDEKKYFWLQGWDGKLLTSEAQVTTIGQDKSIKKKIARMLHNSRSYYQGLLREFMPEREFAIVNALVLGDRGHIDYETRDQIKNLGLSHLFALSGLHVGIIVLFVIGVWDRLGISRDRTYLFLLVLLPVYALLTGASPSIVRAVIMAELMILANLITKKSDIFTNIALAAFLLVLLNPKNLLHIGFQLTFIITIGIIIFEPIIDSLLRNMNSKSNRKSSGYGNWLRKFFSVTIAAQVFALPLLVFYFQEFAWSVFLSQFLVLPIISFFILPAGVFMLLVAWIHPALSFFPTVILHKSASVMLMITEKLEFATVFVSKFPEVHFIWLATYFTCAILLAYLMYYRRYATKTIVTTLIVLLVLIGSLWLPKLPTGQLHITLIDVGQGDSIHVETPKGKHILIDGGGWPVYGDYEYDVGERIILPYLYARGIKSLDAVFLSHADHDHVHGLLSVMERFPVKSFIYSVDDQRESFLRLMEIAKDKDIPTYQVSKGDQIQIEKDVVIDILHPDRTVSTAPNNDSIVMEIGYNDRRILLTGDIEKETEHALLEQLMNRPMDLLKVAHHGSRTSSTEQFLQQVKPAYSAISVGRNNRFGHPSEEVLGRLSEIDSEIYRTDQQGAIFFIIHKNEIKVKTMVQ